MLEDADPPGQGSRVAFSLSKLISGPVDYFFLAAPLCTFSPDTTIHDCQCRSGRLQFPCEPNQTDDISGPSSLGAQIRGCSIDALIIRGWTLIVEAANQIMYSVLV